MLLGYFKEFHSDTYEFGSRCSVKEKTDIEKGDCFKIELVDGSLVVQKWLSKQQEFRFVLASSAFNIDNGESSYDYLDKK